MPKDSEQQKETVARVMHEFKHGELKSGSGRKVRNPRQAIAIGLHEAGASNQSSPKENRAALSRTKTKERRSEAAQQQTEGHKSATSAETAVPRSTNKRSGAMSQAVRG